MVIIPNTVVTNANNFRISGCISKIASITQSVSNCSGEMVMIFAFFYSSVQSVLHTFLIYLVCENESNSRGSLPSGDNDGRIYHELHISGYLTTLEISLQSPHQNM